jgi:hypothetical protein
VQSLLLLTAIFTPHIISWSFAIYTRTIGFNPR